jgi:hypothetical protein
MPLFLNVCGSISYDMYNITCTDANRIKSPHSLCGLFYHALGIRSVASNVRVTDELWNGKDMIRHTVITSLNINQQICNGHATFSVQQEPSSKRLCGWTSPHKRLMGFLNYNRKAVYPLQGGTQTEGAWERVPEEIMWTEEIWSERRDRMGYMDWIDLAQDRDQWKVLVNTVMNPRVP